MSKGRFTILEEVTSKLGKKHGNEKLCLQYGFFTYEDNYKEYTYRFMRRDSEGRMRSSIAFIPELDLISILFNKMDKVINK